MGGDFTEKPSLRCLESDLLLRSSWTMFFSSMTEMDQKVHRVVIVTARDELPFT